MADEPFSLILESVIEVSQTVVSSVEPYPVQLYGARFIQPFLLLTASLDASVRVFAPEVMHVVRGDDRDPRFLRKGDQSPVDLLLLGQIVIHQLDVEVLLSEDVEIFVENLLRALHAEITDGAVDFPGQTGA